MTDVLEKPRASEDAALIALNALCVAIMQELRRQSRDPEAMLERLSDDAVSSLARRSDAHPGLDFDKLTKLASASLGSIFSAAQQD